MKKILLSLLLFFSKPKVKPTDKPVSAIYGNMNKAKVKRNKHLRANVTFI